MRRVSEHRAAISYVLDCGDFSNQLGSPLEDQATVLHTNGVRSKFLVGQEVELEILFQGVPL